MAHLTDEQLQEIMLGSVQQADHVATCESCSSRLREMQAVRDRLQQAFASVGAGDELSERILGKLREISPEVAAVSPDVAEVSPEVAPASPEVAAASPDVAPAAPGRRRVIRPGRLVPALAAAAASLGRGRMIRPWRLVPALAAAAAILVTMTAVILYLAKPSAAMAAQAELATIHGYNMTPHDRGPGKFYTSADPAKLAAYLKDSLGFVPAFPRLDKGMSIRQCCVTHFRGTIVGSYVVDTPRGVLSVIVTTDTPKSMGLKRAFVRGSRRFWTGGYAKNNMTAVRLGGYSYCAVGEVEQELLTEILSRLVGG